MKKTTLFIILIATIVLFVAAAESPQFGSVKFEEGVPLADAVRLLESHNINELGFSWYADPDTPTVQKIGYDPDIHTPETIEIEFWRKYIPGSIDFFQYGLNLHGEDERYRQPLEALKSINGSWETESCPAIYVLEVETYGTGSAHRSINASPLVEQAELQIITAARAAGNSFFGERSKSYRKNGLKTGIFRRHLPV